jgi:hypothetical protein
VPTTGLLVKQGQRKNLCIVAEEVDESEYWLEVIKETSLSNEIEALEGLLTESIERNKIMSKAKN